MKILCILYVLVGLSACTSLGVVTDQTSIDNDESIFVIGVPHSKYMIIVSRGQVQNGAFNENQWSSYAYKGVSRNGYVVGKAKEGETLAVTMIIKGDLLGPKFVPCHGLKTLVFNVSKQKAIYVSDMSFTGNESEYLAIEYEDRFEEAKKYIEENYSNINTELVNEEFRLLPAQVYLCRY